VADIWRASVLKIDGSKLYGSPRLLARYGPFRRSKRSMQVREQFSGPPEAFVQPGTYLTLDVHGRDRNVFLSNDAITQYLGLRPGSQLMVEEACDFIARHRELIIKAADMKLRRARSSDGQIILGCGDLRVRSQISQNGPAIASSAKRRRR
jgi:hypothetical protein